LAYHFTCLPLNSKQVAVSLTIMTNLSALQSASALLRRRDRVLPKLHFGCAKIENITNDSQQIMTDIFDVMESLGQGSTSVVQRACRKSDGKEVALKVMRTDDPEMISTAREEYELLRKIHHPHIVKAVDFITLQTKVITVMEFFHGHSLDKAVTCCQLGKFSEAVSRHLSSQLVSAVHYLHQRGIVHRDIKPQNLLVSSDLGDVRLVDFNVAHGGSDSCPLTPIGTRLYVAPEVLLGQPGSFPADIWAVGLCMHLMLTGLLPQGRDQWGHVSRQQLSEGNEEVVFTGAIWRCVSEECRAIVSHCLQVQEHKRPSAMTLAEDSWIGGTKNSAAVKMKARLC